jgi:hypothetical protein
MAVSTCKLCGYAEEDLFHAPTACDHAKMCCQGPFHKTKIRAKGLAELDHN